MARKQLHAIAAALLVVGGLVLAFTSSVEAGFAGLACAVAAAGVMAYASTRPKQ